MGAVARPGRMAIPRRASMPALLMTRPGRRLHQRGVEPVVAARRPSPGWPASRRGRRQARRQRAARVLGRDRGRVGEHRVGPGDLAEREGIGLDAAAVDRRPELRRGRAERPRDRRPVGDLRRVARLPVVGRVPAAEPAQQERDGVLAGAHVPDRARLLAVAGQPGGGQRVERHALGAAGQQRLADPGPPVDALERPDVEVLARMRARQDRDLGRLEVERLDAAGLDEGQDPERLDRRAEGDQPIRDRRAGGSPGRPRRPRRCRPGGRSPRCRCGPGGRGSAGRSGRGPRRPMAGPTFWRRGRAGLAGTVKVDGSPVGGGGRSRAG